MHLHQPNSANQQVFYMPEVLEIIIHELPTSSDLARMARVAFLPHKPSIKRLWSGQMFPNGSDFDHLINLFPTGLITSNGYKRSFSRPLLDSDWIRFEHYSVYLQSITTLGDPPLSQGAISFPELFSAIDCRRHFPRLRTVNTDWEFILRNPPWMKIAGSQLEELSIVNDLGIALARPYVRILEDLVKGLPVQVPNIKKLDLPPFEVLYFPGFPVELEQALNASLPLLQKLESLIIELDISIPASVIKTILSKRHLVTLQLGEVELPAGSSIEGGRLPLLESIKLRGHASSLCLCLETLQHPCEMVDITLGVLDAISLFSVQPILQCVNLTDLQLTFVDISVPVPWSHLKPILACQHICIFHLELTTVLEEFDEAALEELGNSWKDLSKFTLDEGGAFDLDHDSPIALVALGTLANSCPQLSHLQLTVSTRPVQWSLSSQELLEKMNGDQYKTEAKQLEFLGLTYTQLEPSPVRNNPLDFLKPRQVAQILRRIWPRNPAEPLQTSWEDPEQLSMWIEVLECLIEAKETERVKSELQRQNEDLEAENVQLRLKVAALELQIAEKYGS